MMVDLNILHIDLTIFASDFKGASAYEDNEQFCLSDSFFCLYSGLIFWCIKGW